MKLVGTQDKFTSAAKLKDKKRGVISKEEYLMRLRVY